MLYAVYKTAPANRELSEYEKEPIYFTNHDEALKMFELFCQTNTDERPVFEKVNVKIPKDVEEKFKEMHRYHFTIKDGVLDTCNGAFAINLNSSFDDYMSHSLFGNSTMPSDIYNVARIIHDEYVNTPKENFSLSDFMDNVKGILNDPATYALKRKPELQQEVNNIAETLNIKKEAMPEFIKLAINDSQGWNWEYKAALFAAEIINCAKNPELTTPEISRRAADIISNKHEITPEFIQKVINKFSETPDNININKPALLIADPSVLSVRLKCEAEAAKTELNSKNIEKDEIDISTKGKYNFSL